MICDRVAIIVNGQIVNQGRLQDLISEKILFTEITLSGINTDNLKDFGEIISSTGGKILLKVVNEDNIERVIGIVQAQKGKIHSLIPRTATLEDLFVDMVKQR